MEQPVVNPRRPRYETYTEVKKIYNVSPETVKNWARNGSIRYRCVQNTTRKTWLYDIDSIGEYLQNNTDNVERAEEKAGRRPVRIIYTRVSSAKQEADLQRQQELLLTAFPDTEIISDIGSGLNFHRPGFTKLVRQICRDRVSQVVVSYRDRIARFGYELFELLCKEHNCSILVYGEQLDDNHAVDRETELKDDLLAVVNVFVASHNGKRAAALKRERKRLADENGKDKTIPDETTAETASVNV